MARGLDRFNICEICKKPISDNTLCFDCLKLKKRAQEFAVNMDATTEEVSKEFGINKKLLDTWVNKGSFWCQAPCRSCGKMVKGGNVCIDCRHRFRTELERKIF